MRYTDTFAKKLVDQMTLDQKVGAACRSLNLLRDLDVLRWLLANLLQACMSHGLRTKLVPLILKWADARLWLFPLPVWRQNGSC